MELRLDNRHSRFRRFAARNMSTPSPSQLPLDQLSPQERAILDYAIEGLTDVQIAQKLDISQSTVNSY